MLEADGGSGNVVGQGRDPVGGVDLHRCWGLHQHGGVRPLEVMQWQCSMEVDWTDSARRVMAMSGALISYCDWRGGGTEGWSADFELGALGDRSLNGGEGAWKFCKMQIYRWCKMTCLQLSLFVGKHSMVSNRETIDLTPLWTTAIGMMSIVPAVEKEGSRAHW